MGTELAQRGARLLVYGGPFLEAEVVRGFVAGRPKQDHSILMWYTKDNEPPPFPEEASHPKLFLRRDERGADWEVAFYRAIARADGIILMGGGSSTKISGQVAMGARMPILALSEFGGGAATVCMLFLVPLVAGGAGAAIRPMVDRQRGIHPAAPAVLATIVLGLVAGGIAGVLQAN